MKVGKNGNAYDFMSSLENELNTKRNQCCSDILFEKNDTLWV